MTDTPKMSRSQNEHSAREMLELLKRSRRCLNRFGARYAGVDHAKTDQKEARLIVEAIDELLLRL